MRCIVDAVSLKVTGTGAWFPLCVDMGKERYLFDWSRLKKMSRQAKVAKIL